MNEYFHIKTKKGDIIIRDGTRYELKDLVTEYKKSFKKHNIFQKSAFRVEEYLIDAHRKYHKFGGGFIVAKIYNNTIGGILIRTGEFNTDKKHSLFYFNHLVVAKKYTKLGLGTRLVNAAEQKIKNLIKEKKFRSAKVEVHCYEKKMVNFYKRLKFKIEGKLASHYRFKQTVYVFGKEIIK